MGLVQPVEVLAIHSTESGAVFEFAAKSHHPKLVHMKAELGEMVGDDSAEALRLLAPAIAVFLNLHGVTSCASIADLAGLERKSQGPKLPDALVRAVEEGGKQDAHLAIVLACVRRALKQERCHRASLSRVLLPHCTLEAWLSSRMNGMERATQLDSELMQKETELQAKVAEIVRLRRKYQGAIAVGVMNSLHA